MGTVNSECQGLLQKWILDELKVGIEGHNAAAASSDGKAHKVFDQFRAGVLHLEKYFFEVADRLHQDGQRKLHHHRAQRAPEHDQRRRGLQHLSNLTTVQVQANRNAKDCNEDSKQGASIHCGLPSGASAS
jgi:hypothetical protein